MRLNPALLTATVTLTCGHVVRTRNVPLPRTTLVCTANQGCGYLLNWTTTEAGGEIFYNRLPEPRNEETSR